MFFCGRDTSPVGDPAEVASEPRPKTLSCNRLFRALCGGLDLKNADWVLNI
jgi:hypothetical protein